MEQLNVNDYDFSEVKHYMLFDDNKLVIFRDKDEQIASHIFKLNEEEKNTIIQCLMHAYNLYINYETNEITQGIRVGYES